MCSSESDGLSLNDFDDLVMRELTPMVVTTICDMQSHDRSRALSELLVREECLSMAAVVSTTFINPPLASRDPP